MKKPLTSVALLLAAVTVSVATAQKTPDIRLDTSATGVSATARPQIAASGDSIYVTWGAFGELYFNRSLDGGATWLAAEIRVDTDPGTHYSGTPRIAAADDAVYVVFRDGRNGDADIYFNRSLDRGTTWLTSDIRLDSGSGGSARQSYGPHIAVCGNSVYVVWRESNLGGYDIQCNVSHDRGATWGADFRLDTAQVPHAYSSWLDIVAVTDAVYVAWNDNRNGDYDIHFNRSLDGGASWLAADRRLDTDPVGATYSGQPRIAAHGDSVYVVWGDSRNIQSDVYFNRSFDRGATWLANDIRLNNTVPGVDGSGAPRIAVWGDVVYVVWNDWRNGSHDVYFDVSHDAGTSWLSSDVRLDTDLPGPSHSDACELAAVREAVYVTWQDQRNGQRDIYFNRSSDSGATWLTSDVRLDADPPGAGASTGPQIAASGSSVYVTWADGRNAPPWDDSRDDIYFNIPFGAQPYGTGTAGTGRFTPRLDASDSLTLGSTFVVTVTDGIGGALGALALGGPGSQVAIPVLGGSLLVYPIDVVLPIALLGAAGVPGEGQAKIELTVPMDTFLIGRNENFQALVLDAGAVAGVAMSNGVEAWIL